MKKGLTLVELLVVMVMLSLLVGIMFPALARTKEEAGKTRCMNNLRIIGQAISAYASDHAGYSPEISGPLYTDAGNADQLRYPWPVKDQSAFAPLGASGLAADGECAGTLGSNSVTIGQPQWWQASPAKPARATGLGHLWASGYLTSAGAQTLYCPSNESPPLAKKKRHDERFMFDEDEPFWTSKGTVVRANDNAFGDWKISRAIYGFEVCYDGTSGLNRGKCLVLSNYSMRFPKAAVKINPKAIRPMPPHPKLVPGAIFPTSYKLKEIGKLGIVADHTEPLLGQSRFQLGNNNWAPDEEECLEKVPPYLVANHDAAWNILFPDGSVKTYSDESKKVQRAMCLWWKTALYNFAEESARKVMGWEDQHVWTPYFDAVY